MKNTMSNKNSIDGADSSELSDSSKRAYTTAFTKIDATAKLQIIQALDSGQPKSDIAREYGVHPQTVAYIYKQKDIIIKKYTQRYNILKEVCSLNLEQNLLEWFEQQCTSGKNVKEDDLHMKAKDILKDLSQEFTSISDWLQSFRIRHNISKYSSDSSHDEKAKETWKNFLKKSDTNAVYLGGVCALAYSLDLTSYLEGKAGVDYVSIFFIVNTLGTDKKELAVVGNETLANDSNVKSLPVKYFHCDNTQINFSIINNYLTKWDSDLSSQGKTITLILNVPTNMYSKFQFYNIKLISPADMNYIPVMVDNIVESFKCHYRKLHISRSTTYGKDNCLFLDYIHMIAMAWHCLPFKHIQSLCFPPEQNCLYFKNESNGDDFSISEWCKSNNFKYDLEGGSDDLDKYIQCDENVPCLNCDQIENNLHKVTEVLVETSCMPTSAIEAYQAMKRLVSYLQGENSSGPVIKYAKYLENHVEYGALLQMHHIIASTNGNMLDE